MLPGLVLALMLAGASDFDTVSRQADAARLAHRPNDAIRLYGEAVKLRPDWAEGWWRLGAFLFDQERFGEAEPALRQYVKSQAKPAMATALLGLCEYESRELDRAVAHFREWEKAGAPGNAQIGETVRFHWALALNRRGRFEEAWGLLRGGEESPHLVEAAGLNALRLPWLPEEYPSRYRESIYLAGRARLRGVEPGSAAEPEGEHSSPAEHGSALLESLRRTVAETPTAENWARVGLAEFDAHQYWRALIHLRKALGMGPSDLLWSVRFHTAILLTRFERFDDGNDLLAFFGAAGRRSEAVVQAMGLAGMRVPFLPAEMPPRYAEMVRLAGSAAYEIAAQNEPEAVRLCRELVERFPREPNAHYLLGTYLLKKDSVAGIAELKQVLALDASHASARVRLALEYLKRGEIDHGLPYAREAVGRSPKSFAAHLALGRLLVEKEELQEGVRELEAARNLAPGMAHVRWSLANAYTRAGRNEEARRELEAFEKLR